MAAISEQQNKIQLPIESFSTPLAETLGVRPGPIDPSIVDEMEERGFDFVPVISDKGGVFGLIDRKTLRELVSTGSNLDSSDSRLRRAVVKIGEGLSRIIYILSEDPAVFVIPQEPSLPDHSWPVEDVIGLLTVADLNRPAIRGALYPLFAKLEVFLSSILKEKYPDPWDWLETLGKDKQARIVGYWEVSKRANVDIGPAASLMLSDLLNLFERKDNLRNELGFSKKQWKEQTSGIVDLRNLVMHPVRPMFDPREDLKKTGRAVKRLGELVELIE